MERGFIVFGSSDPEHTDRIAQMLNFLPQDARVCALGALIGANSEIVAQTLGQVLAYSIGAIKAPEEITKDVNMNALFLQALTCLAIYRGDSPGESDLSLMLEFVTELFENEPEAQRGHGASSELVRDLLRQAAAPRFAPDEGRDAQLYYVENRFIAPLADRERFRDLFLMI